LSQQLSIPDQIQISELVSKQDQNFFEQLAKDPDPPLPKPLLNRTSILAEEPEASQKKKKILTSETYFDGNSRERDSVCMMSAVYKYSLCSNVLLSQNAFYDADFENAKIVKEVESLNTTEEFLLSTSKVPLLEF
jgi:hypothetical protein